MSARRNNGPSNAINTTLTDSIASGAGFTGITDLEYCIGTGMACDQDIEFQDYIGPISLGTLTPAQVVNVQLRADVPAGAESSDDLRNCASVSSSVEDPDATDQFCATSDVVEVVDLDVVKDFSGPNPETVTAGSSGNTFTITVTNNGPSNADDVQLADAVDTRLDVTGVLTDTGTCAAPAQLVACDLNDLAHGASAVITVTYSVAAEEDQADVDDAATATDADDNTATGEDSVAGVEVVDLDVIEGWLQPNPETVTAGSSGNTFTITVTNNGPSNADDVQLADAVDAHLDVTGVSTDTGTCAAPGPAGGLRPERPRPRRFRGGRRHLLGGRRARTRPMSTTPPPRPTPMTTPPPVRTPWRSWRSSTSTS